MNKAEFCQLLGMPPSELGDPMDSPGGLVIESLADGLCYIVVPEDTPDADGKTGLMYLGAPLLDGDRVYIGDFPVYAPLPELLATANTDDVATPGKKGTK